NGAGVITLRPRSKVRASFIDRGPPVRFRCSSLLWRHGGELRSKREIVAFLVEGDDPRRVERLGFFRGHPVMFARGVFFASRRFYRPVAVVARSWFPLLKPFARR